MRGWFLTNWGTQSQWVDDSSKQRLKIMKKEMGGINDNSLRSHSGSLWKYRITFFKSHKDGSWAVIYFGESAENDYFNYYTPNMFHYD